MAESVSFNLQTKEPEKPPPPLPSHMRQTAQDKPKPPPVIRTHTSGHASNDLNDTVMLSRQSYQTDSYDAPQPQFTATIKRRSTPAEFAMVLLGIAVMITAVVFIIMPAVDTSVSDIVSSMPLP